MMVSCGTNFAIRYIENGGHLYFQDICRVNDPTSSDDHKTTALTYTAGLRPVFTLKSNVKITGGNGTASNPYTLGV